MIGIYKIENLINKKVYIGQSRNILQRWKGHRASYQKDDTPLYRAIRKYGIENFIFEVIEECEIDQLNDREIYWIDFYNSYKDGYNQNTGGDGNTHPLKLTQQQVDEIYKRLKTSERMVDIAKDYSVSHQTISDINTGKIWVNNKILYPIRDTSKIKKYCIDCGIEIYQDSIRCKKCSTLYKTNILYEQSKYPNREQLKEMIREKSFVQIGKDFGVSDNAIRKWCKHYNLPQKRREINSYSDDEWEKI